jgi:predicted amino acid dehydrogenase
MALMVVGATGSIGSICARMVAPRVRELYLVSPRPEKLLALASEIEQEHPRLKGCIHLSRSTREFLPKVDGIIATTSATEPIIDVAELRPGCLVLDVARPPDIREQAARKRRDVLVIESGEILLPQDAELTVDIGLPRGLIYACLAETVLLALEKRFGHYTLGRQINPSQVNEIAEIAARHGFEMSAIRSFGRPVESRRFRTLAKINTPRFPRLRERQADLFAD